jgi:hypothetical protein
MSSLNFKGIYVIQTRECVDANNNIYKIGQSKNIGKALQKYPNGSKVFYIIECLEPIKYKNKIIKLLKKCIKPELNYGNEFFNLDKDIIIDLIHNYVCFLNLNFRICKTTFIIKTVDENNKYILPKDRDINNVVCETIDYENLTSQILDVIDNNIISHKESYKNLINHVNICKKEDKLNTESLQEYQNLLQIYINTILKLESIKYNLIRDNVI